MGLKYNLWAYDKETCVGVYEEFSKDFGEDHRIMDTIGIPIRDNINNGSFDVVPSWVPALRPLFKRPIELSKYDYQISFEYRDEW